MPLIMLRQPVTYNSTYTCMYTPQMVDFLKWTYYKHFQWSDTINPMQMITCTTVIGSVGSESWESIWVGEVVTLHYKSKENHTLKYFFEDIFKTCVLMR